MTNRYEINGGAIPLPLDRRWILWQQRTQRSQHIATLKHPVERNNGTRTKKKSIKQEARTHTSLSILPLRHILRRLVRSALPPNERHVFLRRALPDIRSRTSKPVVVPPLFSTLTMRGAVGVRGVLPSLWRERFVVLIPCYITPGPLRPARGHSRRCASNSSRRKVEGKILGSG